MTPRLLLPAALALLLGAAPLRSDVPQGPEVAATAVDLHGTVTYDDAGTWRPAAVGQLFAPGDRVATGDGSSLQLVLADGSSVALGENSELSLDAAGDGSPGSVTLLGLARGLLNAFVQKLKDGSRFEVRTPYSVAAVKGTDFQVGADTQDASVTVHDGVVRFGGSGGGAEDLTPLQVGHFRAGHLEPPRLLRPDERAAFEGRWAAARDLHLRRETLLRRLAPRRRLWLNRLRVRNRRRFMVGRRGFRAKPRRRAWSARRRPEDRPRP